MYYDVLSLIYVVESKLECLKLFLKLILEVITVILIAKVCLLINVILCL